MTIIVYSSHTGSTKKYAEILSERTGFPVFSVKDEYDHEQQIVFLGWLNGPHIRGINEVDNSKLIAVATVSLDDHPSFGWPKVKDVNKIKVPIYHLRGWIDRK